MAAATDTAEQIAAPTEHPLIREYRASMDKDTLHDWAVDAVAEMRKCHAVKADLLEALRFYADDPSNPNPSEGPWGVASTDFGEKARAAIAKAVSQ